MSNGGVCAALNDSVKKDVNAEAKFCSRSFVIAINGNSRQAAKS